MSSATARAPWASVGARMLRKAAARVLDAARFVSLYRQHLPLIFEAVFSYRCEVSLLRCRLKGSDAELTLLYVGRRIHYSYLTGTLFDAAVVLERRHLTLWRYRRHAEELAESADLTIFDLGWPYNARHRREGRALEVPDWLELIVDLDGDWADVVSRFRRSTRRNDLRVIRRNGYECEFTSDRQAIESFYDDMYVPFAQQRHADGAVLDPRRHVIKVASKGTLMRVLEQDRVIAAGVLYPAGDVMLFLWMGLPRESLENRPERVISALYFFGMRHAHERGFRIADFMGTRAFLEDGAFLFKRKWGPAVHDTFSPGSLLIAPRRGSDAAAAFCERFPVLARSPLGLEAVYVKREGPVDEAAFHAHREAIGCGGVSGVTIIEIADSDETIDLPSASDGCRYRHIRTRADGFPDAYARRRARAEGA